MKKFFILFVVAIFSFIIFNNANANSISPDENELSFAKKYFSVLYSYDVKAASFAEDSQLINTQENLLNLLELQKEHVQIVKSELVDLKPPVSYVDSYDKVLKGLNKQEAYLNNLIQDINSGLTFDEAFAVNSWKFLQAQKYIQDGVAELKLVIETYSNVNQFKVVAAIGIPEKQLIQNANNCEYYRQVQESVK